jgi:hypothetical protein
MSLRTGTSIKDIKFVENNFKMYSSSMQWDELVKLVIYKEAIAIQPFLMVLAASPVYLSQ